MSADQSQVQELSDSRVRSALGLLALTAVLVAGMMGPQELSAAPLQQVPSDTTEIIPLAPIEITVLRRPFLENQAPLAVSALSEEELQQGRSGFFLEESLFGLPGVQVQNRFNPAVGERIAVRGFGGRAQFGLRGIHVVVDGIPATLPDGQSTLDHLDIASLGQVEAVRGPASALFGNAAGGVLSFTTEPPRPGPYNVEVLGVGGSDGLWRGQVTASGTLERTGYLVSVSGQGWDGYREVTDADRQESFGDSYGSSERYGFNARLTREAAGGELSFTVNAVDLDAENPGSFGNDFREDPEFGINDLYLRFRTGKELQQQQAGLRWVGSLGDAWDADFSVFGINRDVVNPIPFDRIDLSRTGFGARAMVGHAFDTGLGELNWQAGVEADLQDDDRKEFEVAGNFGSPFGIPSETPYLDQAETVRGAGLFVQGDLRLPGGATALAGLRYDSHRFEADDRVPATPDNPDESGSRTLSQFSPSVGVNVPLGGSLRGFASVGTVFETPTTTELANQPNDPGGFNDDLDPMTGASYEVGVRGDLSNLVAFELTTYQTNLENELIPFEVAGSPGVTYYQNAGSSRHRGVEATISAAASDGLVRGDLTYTYTNARFEEYVVDTDEGDLDLADNRIPGIAPQRAQARLRLSPASWWGEVTGSYVDNVPVNDMNTTSAPSYFLVDLRAGLDEIPLGNITVSPWVSVLNAFGEEYIASVAVNAFGGRFFEPGPTRAFQLGMRAVWGGGM